MRARRPLAPSRPLVRFLASSRPFGERMQDRAAAVTRKSSEEGVATPRCPGDHAAGPTPGWSEQVPAEEQTRPTRVPSAVFRCRPHAPFTLARGPQEAHREAQSRGHEQRSPNGAMLAGAGGSVPKAARQPPVLGKGREGRCAGTGLEARPHVCDVLGSSDLRASPPCGWEGRGSLFFRVCSFVDWRLPP